MAPPPISSPSPAWHPPTVADKDSCGEGCQGHKDPGGHVPAEFGSQTMDPAMMECRAAEVGGVVGVALREWVWEGVAEGYLNATKKVRYAAKNHMNWAWLEGMP